MTTRPDLRWNLNIHYHRVVLDNVGAGATRALDVGCGDGLLAFDLADAGLDVVGIDPDTASVARARADARAGHNPRFVVCDLFDHQFEPGSFDVVASIAALHHMDAERGLRVMAELVAPGGVLAVVGLARPDSIATHGLAVAGRGLKGAQKLRGRLWDHAAPIVWPPPLTMSEMAAVARAVLPGVEDRRLLSGRYSLIWRAPPG